MKMGPITTLFFIHVGLSRPFILEMDAFDFVLNAIFSQIGEDNLFQLVGVYSCNFFPTKINYEIHAKKLLAIMDAFEEWHHLFKGAQHEIIMYYDHKNF